MSITVDELTRARELVYRLLDELQVDAYLFEIEPDKEQWQILIECAMNEGWERIRLGIAPEDLLASKDDVVLHKKLVSHWREKLSACKKKSN